MIDPTVSVPRQVKYLSVCSGIEAASVAWKPLGMRPVAVAEVDRFPSAVLAHRHPDTPNWGDMTRFAEWPDAAVDLLVGGTPCQSFSVAGLGAGLDDPRGQLMLVYLAVARRYRPRWVVWENVPGVLSNDGGRAFGSLLGGLAELGYGFAHRVLDAQFFGLAQRRQRVFVVGCAGDWRRAAAVLFERESLSGHPAPRREAWEGTPAGALGGTSPGGGWRFGADEAAAGQLIANTMQAGDGKRGHDEQRTYVAHCLNAKGGAGRIDAESKTFIAHSLRADGFDASEDGTGRGTPLVAIPIDMRQASRGATMTNNRGDGVASGGAPGTGIGEDGDPSPTIGTSHTPAVAFNHQSGGDMRGIELRPLAQLQRAQVSATLTASAVRRLTPLECERLQGFPDGYTAITYRGKPAADGPRYKALGNSMAVPVMAWIGRRIQMVEQIA